MSYYDILLTLEMQIYYTRKDFDMTKRLNDKSNDYGWVVNDL